MKTFKAHVQIKDRYVEVRIQARTLADAKDLLEAQYGRGIRMNGPFEIR